MKYIKNNAVLENFSVRVTDRWEWIHSIFLQHFHYFGLHYYNGSALVTGISFDKRITEEDWLNTSVIYFNVRSVRPSVCPLHLRTILLCQLGGLGIIFFVSQIWRVIKPPLQRDVIFKYDRQPPAAENNAH